MSLKIISLLFIIIVLCIACELNNEASESYYNATDSHNEGTNCMICHQSGEEGTGWFTVAGTVYDPGRLSPAVNPTIIFTTLPNGGGREVLYLEGDARGNFYTTRSLDFTSKGLYVTLIGSSSNIRHMQAPVKNGSCNSCHGVNTKSLWIDWANNTTCELIVLAFNSLK